MNPANPESLEFKLCFLPAVSGQPWRAMLIGPEPQEQIRFESMRELVHYLRALTEPQTHRGLR